MSLMLILSITIRLIALGVALVLLARLRDWRVGFLAAMVGLMALRQILTLSKGPLTWTISFAANFDELPGLAVSILALLAIWFLGRMIRERQRADEERERDRTFLQVMLDSVEDGIVACDAKGRISLFNRATREFHGLAEKPIPPDEWAEHYNLYMPDGVTPMRPEDIPLYRALTGEVVRDVEMVIVPKSGTRRTLRASGRAMVDALGNSLGAVVSMHDVTERRRAEEALRLTQFAIDHASDAAYWLDRDGRMVYVNDTTCKLLGYTREELLSLNVTDIDPDTTLEDFARAFDRIREISSSTFEARHRAKDGANIPVEVSIHYLKYGDTELMNCIARDITERKRAEEEIRQLNLQNELILNSAGEGVYGLDLEGRTTFINPAAAMMIGWEPDELIGRGQHDVLHHTKPDGSPYPREDCPIYAAFKDGKPHHVSNEVFWRKDGTCFPVEYTSTPIREDGELVGAVVVFHDITERKAMEAQLLQAQKMEAVGKLTGGIAHDFNNLLTVILGNLQLLERRVEGDERLSKRIRAASGAALRGAELTKRLLAFSRRQVLEPEVADLNKLVAGMDDLLRRTLGETIEINVALEADLWPVRVDLNQLENALLNLAINARDAMLEGGRLTIETANASLDDEYTARYPYVTAGRYVMLAVSDTGSGMPPAVIERVFEPFFTTKEVGNGTGLGLSMVYGFVKQSGGHVNIYSEEGHGTTVKLYLPEAGPGDAAALEEAAHEGANEAPAPTGGETILVVEDEAGVREIAVSLLKRCGYRVLEAEDGAAALKILDEHPDIDLLLTDVVMPGGMGGPDLARNARERRPDLKVLYTSGYPESAIVHRGALDEGVEMIGKPYQKDELAQKVRRVLDS
ncbi:MAG: PAS domain S-box protein [Proteobacteria bacterium]|nr:PAS domain S-box protein [Pseudomonadota bacterium]